MPHTCTAAPRPSIECAGCGNSTTVLAHACGDTVPSGFNVTLHLPVIPRDLPDAVSKLLTALRGFSMPTSGAMTRTFKFEHLIIAVDATEKTMAGALAACCATRAALITTPTLLPRLLHASTCASVIRMTYEPQHISSALRRLFGARAATSKRVSSLLASGKTHLQLYSLLANSLRVATRYTLHLDVDAVLFFAARGAASAAATTALVSPLEALMRYTRERQHANRRILGVSVEACRTLWACVPACPGYAYPSRHALHGAEILNTEAFVLDMPALDAALPPQGDLTYLEHTYDERHRTLLVEGAPHNLSVDLLIERWAVRNALAARIARSPDGAANSSVCHSTFQHLDRMLNETQHEPRLTHCCAPTCAPHAPALCQHKLERLRRTFDEAPRVVREAAAMCSRAK